MIAAPPLDDSDMIKLGAGHFHGGCAYCHGAPDLAVNPIANQMLPPPPPLSEAVKHWSAEELFWIVKHGIKYTGMPGWVAQQRDDEVWAVVAFLKELPRLSVSEYQELAYGPLPLDSRTGQELATDLSRPRAADACARCHGSGPNGPTSNLVPVLHGQSPEYLVRSLEAYTNGLRRSGIMEPLASVLGADPKQNLAQYYAGLPLPRARQAPERADPDLIANGRRLAMEGAVNNGIPPCTSCHAGTALPAYPRLAGQHAAYMRQRLHLWKRGLNAASETGAIMAPIAKQLSDQQIREVTAYFASLAAQ
jgi:cytochrome c553